jgi:hypothetical protein
MLSSVHVVAMAKIHPAQYLPQRSVIWAILAPWIRGRQRAPLFLYVNNQSK